METDKAIEYINPGIRKMKKYQKVIQDVPVKLNQNEGPYDWPEKIKSKLGDFSVRQPWNRYPEISAKELRWKLAEFTGVSAEQILTGNGSNEILLMLFLAFGNRKAPLITCDPCFSLYGLLASGLEIKEIKVPLTENLEYNAEAITETSGTNPGSMIMVCSPCNPTGCSFTKQDITHILDNHKGMFILDQAYAEFGGYNAVELIDKYPNLLVIRTFSKAMGGAGFRLGYLMGNQKVIAELDKIRLPYNIDPFTSYAAVTMLSNLQIAEKNISDIIKERDNLFDFLRTLPLKNCYKSDANFILIRLKDKDKLYNYLLDNGILLRDVSSYNYLEGCLRISVGTPSENRQLKNHLKDFFNA